jgi:tetratricopeptide (TPR) repeat protein
VELLTAARGASDSKTLEAEYQFISILVQTNRLDAAGKMLDSADQLAGQRLSEYSELALKAHWSRAGYFKLRMSPGHALEEYSAAERIRTVVEPANDALKLRLRDALSWCYARLNRNEDAERVLRDLMTPAYPPERVGPLYWAQARIDYGISLKVLGRNDEAERVMVSGLRELREALGADHYFVAVVQNELGDLYVRQSRWPQAVDSLREAYAILRKRSGEHGQATLIAAANLGIVEYRTGHLAEAVQVLSGTHEDMARQLGLASPQAQSVAFYLAAALSDIGRNSDAAELLAPLKATDLAAAEPREDWEPRLAALRAEILIRQGDRRAGLPKLAAAVERMEASHSPPEDVAPLRKLLGGTNGRSASSSH